jgi:aldose 1-epimerase
VIANRTAPPCAPSGWESQHLLRLLDPSGNAAAWVSPTDGGNTIAFALRAGDDWRQVLFIEGPEALRARPTRYGCPVLFPFPGYARDARYRWHDEVRTLPVNAPDGRSHVHGFAHDRPWEVVDVRADRVTMAFATSRALTSAERESYPFDIVVRQIVSVSNGTLDIEVEARNHGESVAPVGLGLHPYLDPAFLASDRNEITVMMPGTLERVLEGPVPTGNAKAVPSLKRSLSEGGELICRTGFAGPATVSLRGKTGPAIHMDLRGDWSDVVLFTPPDQPSVAIEPLTCALSAASLDPSSSASLPHLPPSGRVAGGIRLRLSS